MKNRVEVAPKFWLETSRSTGPPPGPGRIVNRPCTSRIRRASRSEPRPTSNVVNISLSGGSREPGGSLRRSASCKISRATTSATLRLRRTVGERVIRSPCRPAGGRRQQDRDPPVGDLYRIGRGPVLGDREQRAA